MTTTVTFRPRRDGQPYDPVTYGGAVTLCRVYADPARTAKVAEAGPADRVAFGLYRFTLPNLADGTYYTTIVYTERAGDPPTADDNDRFTLPVADPLIRRLRGLVAEPTQDRYTDNDLVGYLDANTTVDGQVDLYAAAADVWEEKAAAESAAAAARDAGQGRVASVSTGDQSVTYAAAGTSQVYGATTAASMARAMRARSMAKTVRVTSPGAYPWRLRPEQVDAGIGHALGYAPEAADLAGLYDGNR